MSKIQNIRLTTTSKDLRMDAPAIFKCHIQNPLKKWQPELWHSYETPSKFASSLLPAFGIYVHEVIAYKKHRTCDCSQQPVHKHELPFSLCCCYINWHHAIKTQIPVMVTELVPPSTLHSSKEFKCHIPPFDNVQIIIHIASDHIECRWASCWNTLQASYLLPHLAYMQRRLVPNTDIRLTTATLHMDLHMNVGLPSSTTTACKPAHSIIEKWSGIMPSWQVFVCKLCFNSSQSASSFVIIFFCLRIRT